MDFKLPNNNFDEKQLKLLESIQLSQNNILAKCEDLSDRISKLENSQRNISLACQQKSENDDDDFLLEKLNLNIFLSIAATFIICIILVILSWHFWDIPSQTQAVNDYIYTKIVNETASHNSP